MLKTIKKIKDMTDAELKAGYDELNHEIHLLLLSMKSGSNKDAQYKRLDDRRNALYREAYNRSN